MLSVVRKAWHKKIRQTQNDRARTLNAEEILRYTRRIIQMERLQFTSSLPGDAPCADVYFVTPNDVTTLPARCYTVYVTTQISDSQIEMLTRTLLSDALIVNYDVGIDTRSFGLLPKRELEKDLLSEWRHMCLYLQNRGIRQSDLDVGNGNDPDLNIVLDNLLGVGHEFTELSSAFQHRLDVSQPLVTIAETTKARMMTLLRLAHRVQALTPPNPHLKQIFGSTETLFLRDRSAELLALPEPAFGTCA